MKENISMEQAKNIMAQINIVVYGTIRNIENHFLKSFSNLDILTTYFNQVYIIILENDSNDRTRTLLTEWYKSHSSSSIKKHIILLEHLDEKYPLRAHRLAYCRNIILDYIFNNHLENHYSYAFHCDMDDRFWSIDFNSIITCFQYDSNQWDMMSCVNKNDQYYDWWALRCNETWFNKNIFSCDAKGHIDNITNVEYFYQTKIGEFARFLKQQSLVNVQSSFNGLAIYKLSSMKNCLYSADYYCNHCHNTQEGCKEDNDHIGLHRQMIEKGCKLFINTKMMLTNIPKNTLPYNDFILSIKNKIPILHKCPLTFLLMNDLASCNGLWLYFGINDIEKINQISKYHQNDLFIFENFNKTKDEYKGNKKVEYTYDKFQIEIKPFINKNVKFFIGNIIDNISTLKNDIFKNNYVSFIFIDNLCYQNTKNILCSLLYKINQNHILFFHQFANYKNFFLYEFKAFYEFVHEYNIHYEFIGMKKPFQINTIHESESIDRSIAIRVIYNPYFKQTEGIETQEGLMIDSNTDYFDWKFYINHYQDLKHIQKEEEAWNHWIHHGSKEGRVCRLNTNQIPEEKELLHSIISTPSVNTTDSIDPDFDWKFYVNHYNDLNHVKKKEEAYNHWIHYGSKEGRICNLNQLNPYKEDNKDLIDPDFDWKYYIRKYSDLSNITTKEHAWYHWIHHGCKEGRNYDSFDWILYLKINPELKEQDITTREQAKKHWTQQGRKEIFINKRMKE